MPWKEIFTMASQVATSTGILLIIIQLAITIRALKKSVELNRINSISQFINIDEKYIDLENQIKRIVEENDMTYPECLNERHLLDKVYNIERIRILIQKNLNMIEKFCAAYQYHAVDRELVYHMFGGSIVHVFDSYNGFIKLFRNKKKAPMCYIELEKTAYELDIRDLNVKRKVLKREELSNKFDGVRNKE